MWLLMCELYSFILRKKLSRIIGEWFSIDVDREEKTHLSACSERWL